MPLPALHRVPFSLSDSGHGAGPLDDSSRVSLKRRIRDIISPLQLLADVLKRRGDSGDVSSVDHTPRQARLADLAKLVVRLVLPSALAADAGYVCWRGE